jgi:hypothetical protein
MQIISLFLSKDSRTFMLELKAQSRHNVEKSMKECCNIFAGKFRTSWKQVTA